MKATCLRQVNTHARGREAVNHRAIHASSFPRKLIKYSNEQYRSASKLSFPCKLDVRNIKCRATDNSSELSPSEKGKLDTNEYIMSMPTVDPNSPNPELGDIASRVPHDWFDVKQDRLTFKEDQEYWFTVPPGGWKVHKSEKLRILKEEDAQIVCSADHIGDGRAKLTDFQEGQVITGEITEIALYHGFIVDLGAEFDGLIPVKDQQMWGQLMDTGAHMAHGEGDLDLGTMCQVRIHKIRDPQLYRWPIQLVLESPSYDFMSPSGWDPDSWRCPRDLRDVCRPEQLSKFFTEEELNMATARYYPDPEIPPPWEEKKHEEKDYHFLEENTSDINGQKYAAWMPVPYDDDGNQLTGLFIRNGVEVVPKSELAGPDVDEVMQDPEAELQMELLQEMLAEESPPDSDFTEWVYE